MVKHTWVLLAVLLVACGGGDGGDGAGVIDIDSGQDALQDAGQSVWQDAGQDVSRETLVGEAGACWVQTWGWPNIPTVCTPNDDGSMYGSCEPGFMLETLSTVIPGCKEIYMADGCTAGINCHDGSAVNGSSCCVKGS